METKDDYIREMKKQRTPENEQLRKVNKCETMKTLKALRHEHEIILRENEAIKLATQRRSTSELKQFYLKLKLQLLNPGSCFDCGLIGGHPGTNACDDERLIDYNLTTFQSEEELVEHHFPHRGRPNTDQTLLTLTSDLKEANRLSEVMSNVLDVIRRAELRVTQLEFNILNFVNMDLVECTERIAKIFVVAIHAAKIMPSTLFNDIKQIGVSLEERVRAVRGDRIDIDSGKKLSLHYSHLYLKQ